MVRPAHVYLGLVLVAAVTAARPAFGAFEDRLQALRQARVLLDPDASNEAKLGACVQLRGAGDAAVLTIPVLARLSKFDQPNVREHAFETLTGLVGAREANYLLARVDDSSVARSLADLQAWMQSIEIWEETAISSHLRYFDDAALRQARLKIALALWKKAHGGATDESLDVDRSKTSDLLTALGDGLWAISPQRQSVALRLADVLGLDDPTAGPLLLLGIAQADADLRAAMQKHASAMFRPGTHDLAVIRGLVRAVTAPRPPAHVTAAADRFLEAMGPRARSMAVDLALARLVEGYPEALFTLVAWSENNSPLARAVMTLGAIPKEHRPPLAGLLAALAASPDDARNQAVLLLCKEDQRLREHAATLIAADVTRFDRHVVLKEAIQAGFGQSPQVLAHLAPDPKLINPQIALLAEDKDARVRYAACSVLKVTGPTGAGVRRALEALLTDPDDSVCYAAADLLGRGDILIRLEIPPLLKELRNEDLVRRMIAARRLDALGVEPKEFTAALRRAVDRRDMAAREGLTAALESAYAERRPTLQVLEEAADRQVDTPSRAYARAALREISAAARTASGPLQ